MNATHPKTMMLDAPRWISAPMVPNFERFSGTALYGPTVTVFPPDGRGVERSRWTKTRAMGFTIP
jgi:hypothetical protein